MVYFLYLPRGFNVIRVFILSLFLFRRCGTAILSFDSENQNAIPCNGAMEKQHENDVCAMKCINIESTRNGSDMMRSHQVNSVHRFSRFSIAACRAPCSWEWYLWFLSVLLWKCACLLSGTGKIGNKSTKEVAAYRPREIYFKRALFALCVCVCGCVAPIVSGDKYILFDDNNDDFRQRLWVSHTGRKFIFNRKIGSRRIIHTAHAHTHS